MEVKKTKRANIEKSKSTFTLIGLIISLSFVWFSFEYKTYDKSNNNLQAIDLLIDDGDIIMQTVRSKPIPPPPKVISVIKIIENTEKNVPDIDIDIETNTLENIESIIEAEPDEIEYKEKPFFIIVEEAPSFVGGDAARLKYLQDNLHYPAMAKEINTQGTVYIQFIVEKNGEITNVTLARGIGSGCDEAAVMAVKNMPPWNPGLQRGIPVRTRFIMPIKFMLR